MADLSCVDFLPLKYINEVIENSETTAVIRSNISSLSDINSWIDEFGFLSETQWNARSSKPSAEKFVCLKKFVCHHSAFKKIDSDKNKKGISKNFGCSATITAKIKLNTLATRKKDLYVKKGLVGVITINKVHNHSLQTSDTLRFLPADQHIKLKFFEYFNNGMGIAEACRHHEGLLEKTGDSSEGVLASGRINPSKRTVRYWHDQWLENSEQQMDESLSEQETEASLSESDEGTDEAEFVKNGSSMDDANCDEEHEEPLQITAIKEEVTEEETGYIHDDHTEKDASFASVWIKEEVDKEAELENEDEEEEEAIVEEYTNENVSLPAITTVVKEEVTVDDIQSRQYKLELEQPETSTFFQDTSSPQTLLHQMSVEKSADHCELDTHNKVSKSPSKVRKYECDTCDKVFKSRDGLARHKFVHSGIRNYECNVCNKNFSSSSNLAGHKLVHSNIKKHKCHTCDKSFKTFRALKVHKLTHGTEKNYECDICKKAFRLPSTLSQHKSTHSEAKRYQCGVCNKMFPYLHLLSRHDLIHSGIKQYHCDICNKAFSRPYQLKQHKSIHSDVKKYQCDICFKSFAQSAGLSTHKLSHRGTKDYQCDICNNTFATARNLVRHKEIHNGIKQYQCDICNKAFNWLTGLSVHKLTHTGIKYECDICNKILSSASNLARHRLLKHTDIRSNCRY